MPADAFPVRAAEERERPPSPLATLFSLLLPSVCAGCGRPRRGLGGGGACRNCWASLPPPDPHAACPLCALPTGGGECRGCRRQRPPVEGAAAVGEYRGTLKRLVTAFKFDGFDLLAPGLALRMADAARAARLADGVDVVTGVPSTRSRNRDRGYDPGPLLGREVARQMRLPFRRLLRRVASTPPQSSLSAAARALNVASAFSASRRTAALSVLLVDDILTTGATAFAAAAALRAGGASSVRLLVLARTPLYGAGLPEPS